MVKASPMRACPSIKPNLSSRSLPQRFDNDVGKPEFPLLFVLLAHVLRALHYIHCKARFRCVIFPFVCHRSSVRMFRLERNRYFSSEYQRGTLCGGYLGVGGRWLVTIGGQYVHQCIGSSDRPARRRHSGRHKLRFWNRKWTFLFPVSYRIKLHNIALVGECSDREPFRCCLRAVGFPLRRSAGSTP